MLGAIAGDIIGSVHEFQGEKILDFPLFVEESTFTDDSVLTIAVADCLLTGSPYVEKFHEYTLAYPDRGYGGGFWQWVQSGSRAPYNSWGNGAAMRVSPVGFAFGSLEEVLCEAKRSAEVTHNHPEGIRGAQATARQFFSRAKGKQRMGSARLSKTGLITTSAARSRIFDRPIHLTSHVKGQCLKRLQPSSTLLTMKRQSGWPFPSAGTPTPWPALLAGLPRPFTVAFPGVLPNEPCRFWTTNCGLQ